MELLTKELIKKLPALYANEEVEDPEINPEKAAVSSNVYIPYLREKFIEYLDSVGEDKSSRTYRLALGESL